MASPDLAQPDIADLVLTAIWVIAGIVVLGVGVLIGMLFFGINLSDKSDRSD